MSKEDNTKSTKKTTTTNKKKTNSTNSKNKPKVTKKTNTNTETTKENKVISKKEIEKEEIVKVEATDKIKKIEEKAKKEIKAPTSSKSKKDEFIKFATNLDERRKIIYGFVGGLLLGLLIMVLFTPDRIATLKDGTQAVASIDGTNITADELYEDMKNVYSVNKLLDKIDNKILTELYEEDDAMIEKVNSNAEYYLNMYKQYYNYTEEQFLSANGFSSYNEFLEYLKLDYRRTKYEEDYVKENLTNNEIQKYYDENVFGDINCQHVLVSVATDDNSDGLSDDDAKALAQEIINKINDGTKWEDIQTEYKDQITFEDLSYQSWDASLEESFMTALKNMSDNSFSTEPVKTSYGYHVIYRLDQKETPSLDDTKDTIISNLVSDKQSEDTNLLYKALIQLRKDHKIEFNDTVMKKKYEDYCKDYE